MGDPIIRAKNGDTNFFKQVAVSQFQNSYNEDGDSVLSVSVKYNHIHCSRVILTRCPSLLLQSTHTSLYTALHHAGWRGIPSIVKLLISGSGSDKTVFRMFDAQRKQPIIMAIENEMLETVRLLIEGDPDYDYDLPAGLSCEIPLMSAIGRSYGKATDHISVKIRRVLLENQPNQSKLRSGEKGWTALHHATHKGDLQVIEDIIKFCADCIDLLDDDGNNFLHIAVASKNVEVVDYILKIKDIPPSIINGKNKKGNSPLDIAVQSGYKRMLLCFEMFHALSLKTAVKEIVEMNEKEKELSVPPQHLQLYRNLVNQFGEIVPIDLLQSNDSHISVALSEVLSVIAEVVQVKPKHVSHEKISVWEKMASDCSDAGLHVSWFQDYIIQFKLWFLDFRHMEDEIEAQKMVNMQKYEELESLEFQLEELIDESKAFTPPELVLNMYEYDA